ncbi:hypothetical protein FG05_01901 [Fusarium graminearum]|nr:hypothetical protein FG05_01901 [Fusarium graminearum]
MGNFGTAVTSLLDTYTKCLFLLKGTRNHDDGTLSDTHSTLSASLRSDRARVRRVYASRLSKDGSRFEKGDAPARSALRRIIKKLTSTLTNIVSHDGKQQPVRYESLLALSNGSSIEAVRTMNDLSSRVGSRSTISQGSVKARNKSEKRSEGRLRSDKKERKRHSSRQQRSSVGRHRQPSSKGRRHPPDKPATYNRVSILTMSSDSTKLGEIRRRLSKQRPVEGYESMAAYPLYYSPHNEVVQTRKRWWNPFRRSRSTDTDM